MDMKSISFKVGEEEVRQLSEVSLSRGEILEILSNVENDSVLWSDIERSIKDAINMVKPVNNKGIK